MRGEAEELRVLHVCDCPHSGNDVCSERRIEEKRKTEEQRKVHAWGSGSSAGDFR